jgi:hypothetical protein
VEFTIKIECADCGAELSAYQARFDNEIQIEICENCRSDAYNDGYDDASNEYGGHN